MRFLAFCLAITGAASPAVAQPSAPLYEETVVVSAGLTSEEAQQSPVTIDVLTRAEIEARQATSIAELLATLPGVSLVRSGPEGQSASLFVRGGESDQTLVLWNGVELNNPFFGGFNWAFLPTEGVDRVELVRGPGSAVYGSDAIGGVVHVVSARDSGVHLRLEGGDRGYRRAGLTSGASLGESVHLGVTGHLRHGDGELANSFFDGEEVSARLEWAPRSTSTLGLVVRANDSDTGIPLSGGRPSLSRTIGWRERQLAIPFVHESARWGIEAQLSAVDLESAFRDPDDLFGFTSNDTDASAERGRLVATYRAGGALRVAFGGEAERLEATDRSVFGTNLDGARQRTWAGFGEVAYGTETTQIEIGLRHDDNDAFGSELSPRVGVVWAPGPRTRLRAAYAEGFRAPSLGELFFPFSGNPELEPEVSRSFEIAVDHRIDAWRLSLVAFESRQQNLIDFDFPTFSNRNIGRAESRGVELGARFDGALFSGRADVTHLDAQDKRTGLALLRRPEWSAGAALDARLGDWTWNASGRYSGERPDVDPVTFGRAVSPSHAVFDLAGRWQVRPSVAPYARIENVADERYAEALGFPAPGRTAILGVGLDF